MHAKIATRKLKVVAIRPPLWSYYATERGRAMLTVGYSGLKNTAANMEVSMKNFLILLSTCGLTLLLGGCSGQPQTETKKAAEAPQAVTGQSALYRMFQVARTWAPDIQVLKLNSMHLTDVPDVRGKAGAWQAAFVSPEKGLSRSYTYSVEETEPNLHLGVFAGEQGSWSAGRGDKPFVIAAVKIDTDAAYQTALGKVTESERNKGQTISFLLEKLDKFTNPTWRVIWGESVGTSGLSVYIDATTGTYLETMH